MSISICLVTFLCVLGLISTVQGIPTLTARQSITALSPAQIAAFKPFASFASASYCSPSLTKTWSCGANCNAEADFMPVASGGDGSSVQFWYVGFSPSLKTVVVAHQGTDVSKIQAIATDLAAFQTKLDSALFPGISSSIHVHDGFANEHAKTAAQVLGAVQTALLTHGANHVTTVGHSLGAALALLDGIFLPLHLPNISFTTFGFGMPRVGNEAFANFVDSHLSLTHVNNKEDPVPIIPGRFLGYHHPSGEVHIKDSGEIVSCPGHDNPNSQCSTGDVVNVFNGKPSNHEGPYDGVLMRC